MTQVDPTTLACPSCGNTITAPMDGGRRLCISCRHEWNPTDPPRLRAVSDLPIVAPTPAPVEGDARPPAEPSPVPPPAAVAPLDAEVVTDDPAAGTAALEALVGTDVVLEGGQLATITGFPDDDHMEVVISAGTEAERLEVVAFGDVERSVSAPPPVADVPDETAEALARTNMLVAGLAIRAGLASYAGDGAGAELLTPPAGWLPDEMAVPALEQGVGYAFAYLALALNIPRTTMEAVALGMIDTATQDNTPTKGGTESDRLPSGSEHGRGSDAGSGDDTDAGAGADDVHRGGDSENPSE